MAHEGPCFFHQFCPNDVLVFKARKGTTIFMPEQRASFCKI